MEWDPEERDAWVTDAQRWIGQIKGVLQSKIELDADGEILGIHVVAGFDRDPRHIVRDVESLLKARLGIDVYYKKIGVVQVLENDYSPDETAREPGPGGDKTSQAAPSGVTFHAPQEPEHPGETSAEQAPESPESPEQEPSSGARDQQDQQAPERPPIPAILVAADLPPRILCAGVGVLVSESLVRAEVQLSAGDLAVRGMREGPNHPQSDVTLIAEATLAAVGQLLATDVLLHVREITATLGGKEVVLAAVNLVEGRRSEVLFGTCGADHNRQQAVVFAVLDALNRRLSQYPLQDEATGD